MVPQGLYGTMEFITEAEEDELLGRLAECAFERDRFHPVSRVHFGHEFAYLERPGEAPPVPDWLRPVAERVGELPQFERMPDEVIVNRFASGDSLGWHVDHRGLYGPAVASLTLGCGDWRVSFRHPERSADEMHLQTTRRSLYVMTGEARRVWQHRVAPQELPVRFSVTFRTMVAGSG